MDSELLEELYAKIMTDVKREMQQKGKEDKKGKDMDRMKLMKLMSEYKEFKGNNVRHFRFNSASSATTFGKSSLSSCLLTFNYQVKSSIQLFM